MDSPGASSATDSVHSSSKFKSLKKRIRNKFRQALAGTSAETSPKTLSQLTETLRHSKEFLLAEPESVADLRSEFQVLKDTLESIVTQGQVLNEVIQSMDSNCPNPMDRPEDFSLYLARKNSICSSATSISLEDSDEPPQVMQQAEKESYEQRLSQLALLQDEIELLRQQNAEYQIQFDFLKSQRHNQESLQSDSHEEIRRELEGLKLKLEEQSKTSSSKSEELSSARNESESLRLEISRLNAELNSAKSFENDNEGILSSLQSQNQTLQTQLENALTQIKSLEEAMESQCEKDRKARELSEENVRLQMKMEELQQNQIPLETIPAVTDEPKKVDESAFKYIYLSNLVIQFMHNPDQRPQLAQLILATLESDREYFKKANFQ